MGIISMCVLFFLKKKEEKKSFMASLRELKQNNC